MTDASDSLPSSDILVNHIKHHEMNEDTTMHVIGVVSNPAGWHSRLRLARKWIHEMLNTPNVRLYVVEGLYGDHKSELAPGPGQDYGYLSLKLSSELWLKENMINVGVKRLFPPDWRYMTWCDTDLHFRNRNWATGAIRALQTYNVIQPWSHGVAVLADGSARTPIDVSFGNLHANGKPMSLGRHQEKDGYHFAHCGYAWSCTRYWWENVGGLIDFCLIGSADHHMNWSMIGKAMDTIDGRMSEGYKRMVKTWGDRAQRACGGMIGYVPGIVEHGHHGPLKGRKYGERWEILLPNKWKGIRGYDPEVDIAYDGQGVIQYIGENRNHIMQGLINYNRVRNEDSIEA